MIIDQKNIGHYTAEKGKVIVPKNINRENYYSTESIWLSNASDIDKYKEITLRQYQELKKEFEHSNN